MSDPVMICEARGILKLHPVHFHNGVAYRADDKRVAHGLATRDLLPHEPIAPGDVITKGFLRPVEMPK